MSGFNTAKQGASIKCPSCGSTLKFNPQTQKLACDSCHSEYSEEQIKKLSTKTTETTEKSDTKLMDYHCPSCGAELVADEHTTADFCLYCGSPVVLKGRVVGEFQPDTMIPFKITKDKAKELLKEYLLQYSYIPSSFYKEAQLDKISGIYYPFWEADIDTKSSLQAEGRTSHSWIVGNVQYTETKHYDVVRAGDIHFEDITVNAFSGADKNLIENVLPYPIKEHKDFNMEYLSGFYAKKNDLTKEAVASEIHSKMQDYSKQMLLNTINSYESVSVLGSQADIVNESDQYALLPIWIINYKYAGKIWPFAINGVTGKVFGKVPMSRPKFWFTFASVAAGVAALLTLLGGMIL